MTGDVGRPTQAAGAARGPPHALPALEVLAALASDAHRGLEEAAAADALARCGPNELGKPPGIPVWTRLARQLRSLVVWILIGAALLSLALSEPVDAAVIAAIVVLNVAIGFFQEERAARAMEELEVLGAPTARVVRGGRAACVPARELVPGDVVTLEAGDRVPADARLLVAAGLRTQEAALTGESEVVEKRAEEVLDARAPLAERLNLVHMGTVVAAGRAQALVTATGPRTELGRIAGLLEHAASPPTPMQRRLEQLGRLLMVACLVIVATIAVLQWLRGGEPLDVLLGAVSLAVAAVPEGLPVVVTLALALGLQRLARRNALVRRLPSVETLGSVSVICSDKTGTLTRNEMTVRELLVGEQRVEVGGAGYEPRGRFQLVDAAGRATPLDPAGSPLLLEALRTAALCNSASLVPPEEPGEPWSVVGDPTEGALLCAARKAGLELEGVGAPRELFEIPFDSERRAMTVVVREPDGCVQAHTKGGPEAVLAMCSHVLLDGGEARLDEAGRARVLRESARLGERALRVLAVARRRDAPSDPDTVERELVLLGLVGMQDAPREGAREAVRTCREAGIRTLMITGDHPRTALAVARELDLAEPGEGALTGQELDDLDEPALRALVERVSVYARVTAEHKLRVVRALHAHGLVVAMTGDGVNDAPALREADIGIAMGRSGTDVTRAAADMVLLDDDFATIVAAVEEGRCIYADVQKFVHYLLATNAAEVLLVLGAALAGWPVPLTPVQILWINLVTDGLPALALGVEGPERDLMRRPPREPRRPVVTGRDGIWLLACGLLVAGVAALGFQDARAGGADIAQARTTAFTVLVLAQLGCAFVFRSRERTLVALGLLTNRALAAAVLLALLLQVAVVAWEDVGTVFSTAPLTSSSWLAVLVLSLVPATVLELLKLVGAARRGRRASA